MVYATAGISCSKQSTLPTLQYTISPDFIWLPSGATASEIVEQFRGSNPQLQVNSNGTSKAIIQSRIRNFLNTQCNLHLTVNVEKWATVQQSLGLLNQTLSSTDLMCRLATHKLGKTYTENAHIMLSSRLKGWIVPPISKTLTSPIHESDTVSSETSTLPVYLSPSPTSSKVNHLIRRVAQRHFPKSSIEGLAGVAGFEYSITCPRAATATAKAGPTPLEGLKGLAIIRDCDWCQRALTEMQTICRGEAEGIEGIGDLARFMKQSGWGYGGGVCENC
jgi:hypothetical protein